LIRSREIHFLDLYEGGKLPEIAEVRHMKGKSLKIAQKKINSLISIFIQSTHNLNFTGSDTNVEFRIY